MNSERLLNVCCNEIIVAGLRSRVLRGTEFRWRLGEACDSGNICLLLGCRYVAPVNLSVFVPQVPAVELKDVPFLADSQLILGACR